MKKHETLFAGHAQTDDLSLESAAALAAKTVLMTAGADDQQRKRR